MSNVVEDLQMLRVMKAFQKITDPDARRMVVMFVEEQLEKQLRGTGKKPGRTEH